MTYNTLIILALNHFAWPVVCLVGMCVSEIVRACACVSIWLANGGKILTQAVCDKRVSIEQVLACTCTGSLAGMGERHLSSVLVGKRKRTPRVKTAVAKPLSIPVFKN